MEAYRTAKTGDAKATEAAFARLQRAVELTMRGPFMEESGMSRDTLMMFRELPMFLDHLLHRFRPKGDKRPAAKKSKKEEAE